MKRLILFALAVATCCVPSQAQQQNLERDYTLLPEAREIELAKSAGLPAWTSQATIYVLKRGGYVKAQDGTNGFSCMVGRDWPSTRWPICFDPEGTATILPRYLREAELREQGKTREEIRRDTAEQFLTGKYQAPRRVGVAYMLSKENYVSNGSEARWFPPHVMIFGPTILRSAELGSHAQSMPRSPAVLFEGDPHGYLIVVVPDSMPQKPAT